MNKAHYIEPSLEEWLRKFRFSSDIKVRFTETDAYGHVNNVSYFIYFEQARIDYFNEINMFQRFANKAHPSIVVTGDLHCHYHRPIYFGQTLHVKVRTAHIGQTSVDLQYAIIDDQNVLYASGRGAIIHIDKQTGKSTPWSDDIVQGIKYYEQL